MTARARAWLIAVLALVAVGSTTIAILLALERPALQRHAAVGSSVCLLVKNSFYAIRMAMLNHERNAPSWAFAGGLADHPQMLEWCLPGRFPREEFDACRDRDDRPCMVELLQRAELSIDAP
jgi:hypothetical protein